MFQFLSIFKTQRHWLGRLSVILLSGWANIHVAHATDTRLQDPYTDRPISFSVQMGADTWDLRTPEKSEAKLRGVDNLFLANSNTKWNYKNATAWVKTEGQWTIHSNLALTYKARGEQSVGLKLDDLHFDYHLSPKFGLRVGVVDYKTSWCRTYEVDSPWIRENDPFCTTQTTNSATLSAPGLQSYFIFTPSRYHIQTMLGVYRPKVFGYSPDEFSNVVNTNGIAVNHRWGWSLNVLNLENASEFRLSWLAAHQENNRDDGGYRAQRNSTWYLGVSFYPAEKVNLRASILSSKTNQKSLDSPPDYTQILDTTMLRESRSLELIYQLNGQNTLGLGVSRYIHNWDLVGMNGLESYTDPNYVKFVQRGTSVTWRHDWERGIYTSIQWTTSKNDQIYAHTAANAKGNGLGLRLGFSY